MDFVKSCRTLAVGLSVLGAVARLALGVQSQSLTFRPVSAVYSTPLDRMILISASPNVLHIFNAATNSDQTVSLSAPPLGVSLSPDGNHAAVAHSSSVSYVNLQTATVDRVYSVPGGVGQAILSATYLYVLPSYEGTVSSILLSTGANTSQQDVYASEGVFDSATSAIYATIDGLSPDNMIRFDASAGILAGATPNLYQQDDIAFSGPLWLSPDQSKIYSGCGQIFRASRSSTQDRRYVSTFSGVPSIEALDDSGTQIALVPTGSDACGIQSTPDNVVQLFDSSYYNPIGQFLLEPFVVNGVAIAAHGRYVFFNEAKNTIFVVAQADSSAGLVQDFEVYTFSLTSDHCSARFSANSAIAMPSGSYMQVAVTNPSSCTFSAVSTVPWIVLSSNWFGNSSSFGYLVEANLTHASRIGTITLGASTLAVTQAPEGAPTDFNQMSFKVVAADYNKIMDKMVLVSSFPNELHLYDPVTQSDSLVQLPAHPLSVSVRPDGQYAAVGFDGFVATVNLAAGAVDSIFPIDGAISGILLAGNGYLYAFPFVSNGISSLQLSTGVWSTTVANYDNDAPPQLTASGTSFYVGGFEPAQWSISKGTPVQLDGSLTDSAAALWLSDDGSRLYGSNDATLLTSSSPNQDLKPDGSLPVAPDIEWIADSSVQHKVAVIASGYLYNGISTGADDQLQLFDTTYLTLTNQQSLPSFQSAGRQYTSHGKYVTWNRAENKLFVIAEADSSSGLASDFASITIIPSAVPTCTYSLLPASLSFPSYDSSSTLTVNTGCNWQVTTSSNWFLPVTSTGTGSSQITMLTFSNPLETPRSGTLSIGGQVETVAQAAATCGYQFTFTSSSFSSSGGAGVLTLLGNFSNCSWTAIPTVSWLHVTSGSSGAGLNGSVSFTVDPNTGAYRSGNISVAGEMFFISEGGNTPAPSGLYFVPVTPCRVVDTRNAKSELGGPSLVADSARAFAISSGPCGIPITAAAYSLNVTSVPHGKLGYLSIWPAGQPQPVASTLNSYDGRIKANAAIVPAGTNGAVDVYATDASDVVLDVNGYFLPANNQPLGDNLVFYPMPPCRLFDSRDADGPRGGPSLTTGEERDVPIQQSTCGPPAYAQAYWLNMTAIPKNGSIRYLSTWPTGLSRPYVSTLSASDGLVTANAAVVPAGTNGSISVYVTDPADVVVDINGYFAPANYGGFLLYPLIPCRALDTREPPESAPFQGTLDPILNSACNIPSYALGLVLNATVVPAGSLEYLSLWANGAPKPYVSTLNAADGSVTSNMAIVPALQGNISAFASNPTQLILDVSGYFAP